MNFAAPQRTDRYLDEREAMKEMLGKIILPVLGSGW
jgi:hypothetical protein